MDRAGSSNAQQTMDMNTSEKPMDRAILDQVLQQANRIILGKEHAIKLAMTCLLARGHLLIEDMPGMGKTTLAHTLASLLGLKYQRIQFTSDLLPADIIGVSIFDRQSETFRFHPGPIFSQLMLADEINRATPKTQSALLEAMEERQITADGETRALPEPFFVVATQNPAHQVGTFPLPESQLDRFLMRISLGYPEQAMERQLLKGEGGRSALNQAQALANREQLKGWQQQADAVYVSDALLDYVQALVSETRNSSSVTQGLSPRAAQSLLQAAKAWAWLSGRSETFPEDIQAVWSAVVSHRLKSSIDNSSGDALAQQLLRNVAIP